MGDMVETDPDVLFFVAIEDDEFPGEGGSLRARTEARLRREYAERGEPCPDDIECRALVAVIESMSTNAG